LSRRIPIEAVPTGAWFARRRQVIEADQVVPPPARWVPNGSCTRCGDRRAPGLSARLGALTRQPEAISV
jgi:hypothetical protein